MTAPACSASLVLVATLPRMVNPVSADASQELNVRYRAARERWAQLPACAAEVTWQRAGAPEPFLTSHQADGAASSAR